MRIIIGIVSVILLWLSAWSGWGEHAWDKACFELLSSMVLRQWLIEQQEGFEINIWKK